MSGVPSAGQVTPEEAGRRLGEARRLLLVAANPSLAEMLAATPVIANLRQALPGAELVFLAGPACADAVFDHPDLRRVETLPAAGPTAAFRRARLARRTRRESFDAAIHLSLSSPSGKDLAFVRGLRPGFTIGLDDGGPPTPGELPPYDCVIPLPEDARPHMVDRHLMLLESLGYPVVERGHYLAVTPAQAARAERMLLELGMDPERPILGAHPGGSPRRPEQQWPPSHYAAVLQRAGMEAGYQPLLLGSKTDLPTLDTIQALGKQTIPRLLDLPFADYKAVLSLLRFFVTHDGDPVHIAAAVGTRSFFVFLSTPAWKWAPYGSHVSVWTEGGRPPGPAEVWARIRPLLERP